MTAQTMKRGRPVRHSEAWSKITVVLLDRQVAALDQLSIDMRLRHGTHISRAEIIRSLIEAAMESGIDISTAHSEETIKDSMYGGTSKLKKRI